MVMRVHADVDEASPWQLYMEHSAQASPPIEQSTCSHVSVIKSLLLRYHILEILWEPPEAHWSCRQSVTAH